MPTDCSAHMGSDAFNSAKRAGHKFGPRARSPHVPAGDPRLTTVLNPQASEGGVISSNQYPRVESNFPPSAPR